MKKRGSFKDIFRINFKHFRNIDEYLDKRRKQYLLLIYLIRYHNIISILKYRIMIGEEQIKNRSQR